MANTFEGIGILWGATGVTCTAVGIGSTTLMQSVDHTQESDEDLIKDKDGCTKTVVKFDHRAKMTLEFVPETSAADVGTLALASWPSCGSFVTVTDPHFSGNGITGIVDTFNLVRSNTGKAMCRINLTRYLTNAVPT